MERGDGVVEVAELEGRRIACDEQREDPTGAIALATEVDLGEHRLGPVWARHPDSWTVIVATRTDAILQRRRDEPFLDRPPELVERLACQVHDRVADDVTRADIANALRKVDRVCGDHRSAETARIHPEIGEGAIRTDRVRRRMIHQKQVRRVTGGDPLCDRSPHSPRFIEVHSAEPGRMEDIRLDHGASRHVAPVRMRCRHEVRSLRDAHGQRNRRRRAVWSFTAARPIGASDEDGGVEDMDSGQAVVVVAWIDMRDENAADYKRWVVEEHVGQRIAGPGKTAVQCMEALPEETARRLYGDRTLSPRFANIYEGTSLHAFTSPENRRTLTDGPEQSDWSKRVHGYFTRTFRNAYHVFASGTAPARTGGPTYPGPQVTSMVALDVDDDDVSEYKAWIEKEHIATRFSTPGIFSVRCCEAVADAVNPFKAKALAPRFVNIYRSEGIDVLLSDANQRVMTGGREQSEWSKRVHPLFKNMMRNVYVDIVPKVTKAAA
jgi:hypothetical protein